MCGRTHGHYVFVFGSHHHRLGELFAGYVRGSGSFPTGELGSIPALGQAYGLKVLVHETLLEVDDIYFESGDHTELVHMAGEDFRALMARERRGHVGQHV